MSKRVRLIMAPEDGVLIDEPARKSGTVQRVDGAVSWVKWDGTRNETPHLTGTLEAEPA